MKKHIKNLTITLSAMLMMSAVSVASASTIYKNKWTGIYDTIERIYPGSGELVIVLKNHHYYGGLSSICDAGRQFSVRTSDGNYDVKAKMLMAAYLAGHKISPFWTLNTSCRAYMDRFQIRP